MRWTAADIEIVFDADATDDPVVTADVRTPAGDLAVMGEAVLDGRRLTLDGFHMHAQADVPNGYGWPALRRLAQAVMEMLDVDEIVVAGAVRTTGAGPGRRPRPIRFARAPEAER